MVDARIAIAEQWSTDQYRLMDFGQGRKLERFGSLVLDRPCPAADGVRRMSSAAWEAADIVVNQPRSFRAGSAVVAPSAVAVEPATVHAQTPSRNLQQSEWLVRFGGLVFNLKLTPFGHVGLFPEQAENWSWLTRCALRQQSRSQAPGDTPLTALNLFAYTGGTSLALAASGVQVVHVDASAPAVAWAQRNALVSGLDGQAIRWIAEDARKFVARELRRDNRYDIVIMDPPSFGHGPKGQRWKIMDDLPDLLRNAIGLLHSDRPSRLLFTAHCEEPLPARIADIIAATRQPAHIAQDRLRLLDAHARPLDAGFFIRATWD